MKISIHNLSAGYGDNTIIRSLFIDIPCGAFIAVLGHNGSGKSTFLNVLTNKIPFNGTVNYPSAKPSIAMLGQKNHINFSIPVKDLAVMGLFGQKKLFQPYSTAQLNLVMEVLEQNHIAHLAEKDFLTLSGGEQQLVWLSQMMLQNADIYLFDEPTQYLDIAHTHQIFQLMQSMVYEKQKTVICVTHHIHYLQNMDGYLLNLSAEKPVLEAISEKSINDTMEQLSYR